MNKELIEYVRERVDNDEIARAWDVIDQYRCPLSHADSRLYNKIGGLTDDFCYDHDIDKYGDDWEDYDPDYIFGEL